MRDAQDDQGIQPLSSRNKPQNTAQTLDLADRMTAFRRKNAAATRRTERLPPSYQPSIAVAGPSSSSHTPTTSTPTQASPSRRRAPPTSTRRSPSPNDYDRRLGRNHVPGRLFNPDVDPPTVSRAPITSGHRTAPQREPEAMSDTSSVGLPRKSATQSKAKHPQLRQGLQSQRPGSGHPSAPGKQLFDPSRDDPLRFSMLSRQANAASSSTPSAPPNGGYASASSTSDSRSFASSAFTLSSVTSASSVDSNPPYPAKRKEEPGSVNPFVAELKRVYREISLLEKKLLSEEAPSDPADDEPMWAQGTPEAVDDRWIRLIEGHKALAEADHNLLTLATNPNVPASVQSIPDRYNIPTRLWTIAFHRMIGALRRASITSSHALEHLTDFIYFAYRFYSGLLEERNLQPFRGKWLEALGDLASYRMAVAIHVANNAGASSSTATVDKESETLSLPIEPPTARIDDSPVPSIGLRAAAELGEEDERDTWRATAREWYATGLKDTPGTGRLQHHLGTLSRDVKGEELRAVYHFVKSLIAVHPFDSSREALLGFFSPTTQQSLSSPTASAASLFLHIQGLLFTRIDLDQVKPTLARFIERMELDGSAGPSESEWTMMAVLSIGSLLEFGKIDALVRKVGGISGSAPGPTFSIKSGPTSAGVDGGSDRPTSWDSTAPIEEDRIAVKVTAPDEEDEDVADPELNHLSRPMQALTTEPSDSPSHKQAQFVFSLALEVTFATIGYLLKNPYMSAQSPYIQPTLNPYLTVLLTFVSTMFKNAAVLQLMERTVPWESLSEVLGAALRHRSRSSGSASKDKDVGKLPSGQLLPEDWCLRGMEWTGRRVYERGFWKAKGPMGSVQGEIDVIAPSSSGLDGDTNDFVDGIVEDEGEDGMEWEGSISPAQALASTRWKRLRSTAEMLTKAVPGLEWNGSDISIGGELANKVALWKEEERREEEEERARRHRRAGSSDMDVDEDGDDGEDDEDVDGDDSDDPEDSTEVKELKARRRYFRNLLRMSDREARPPRRQERARRAAAPSRPALQVVPGYTVLVVDTNILLSSLSVIASLVNSQKWTIVIPLAVVTELDGLSKNSSPLGNAATDALSYLITAVPANSTTLKVQTSKGNYLHGLSVRSENIDFRNGSSQDRTMDDLILRSALWQADHFIDRQYALDSGSVQAMPTLGTSKVVLLSFDRNLRLKARSRKLDAADEKDMAVILSGVST